MSAAAEMNHKKKVGEGSNKSQVQIEIIIQGQRKIKREKTQLAPS